MSGSRTVLNRLELLALPLGDSGTRSAGDSLSTKSDPAANTTREQDAELERLRTLSFFDSMSGGNPPGSQSGAPSGSGRGSSRSRRSSSTQPPPAGSGALPPFSPPLPGSYGSPYSHYNPYSAHPPHIPPSQQPGASNDPLAALFGPASTVTPHHHTQPPQFAHPGGLPGQVPSLPPYAPWLYGAPPPGGPYGHPGYAHYPAPAPGGPPSHLPPLTPGPGISTGPVGIAAGGSPPGQPRPSGSSREMTAEETAMIEDKRRRNTAASARFRLKKKARTVNLERTVSDLEGRANDLEKEATELRRENTFLKNLIMQRATRRRGGGHRDVQEGPSSRPDQSDSGSEEGEESSESEEDRANRQKGKGKGKGKGKQKDSDGGE